MYQILGVSSIQSSWLLFTGLEISGDHLIFLTLLKQSESMLMGVGQGALGIFE